MTPPPQPERLIDGLPGRPGQRRATGPDRGRRSVHRRRGGRRVGAGASRARGRGARRPAAVDGSPETAPAALAARQSAHLLRRDGLASATARDAGIEPAVAGRRVDPVLGRAVAGAARRHGRGCPATSRRPAVSWRADRADGCGVRDRRPGASAGSRPRVGGRRAAGRVAHRHPRRDGHRPGGAGCGVWPRSGTLPGSTGFYPPVMVRSCCIADPGRTAARRAAWGRWLLFAGLLGCGRGRRTQLGGHRLGQLHRQWGAHRQRRVTATNDRVGQRVSGSRRACRWSRTCPLTTQRIIQR